MKKTKAVSGVLSRPKRRSHRGHPAKVDWARVWVAQDRWFDKTEAGGTYPPSWEEQRANIQQLVERQLRHD